MRNWGAVLLAVLLVACAACKKKDTTSSGQENPVTPPPGATGSSNPPPGAKSSTPFLQGTKNIPARLEWNRDFGSKNGGTVVFRVSCDVPFTVTIVTDKGYQALTSKTKAQFNKSDVLLLTDGRPPSHEGRVTVPPGRAWFIIENRSDSTARMSLECYEGD